MNYVIGDIHNDNCRFEAMLKQIKLRDADHLYLLGDLFDRCNAHADPVGVYFNVLRLDGRVTVLLGNHDLWLADYIDEYYQTPERKRKKMKEHITFEIIKGRLTDVDIMEMSKYIRTFPVQKSIEIGTRHYLLAHAKTSISKGESDLEYFLMGAGDDSFYTEGIEGTISVCAHTDTSFLGKYGGHYSVEGQPSIWRNDRKNVIMVDCGCGFENGRLAGMCLETGEEFYV